MKSNSSCSSPVLTALRRRRWLMHLMMLNLFPGLMQYNDSLMANPQGSVVVHGDVKFGGSAGNLQILQNSHNAIINWDRFSIQAGELTQFRQPNSNSAVLNRVTGGDPSAIHGALKANGNVFVINPNGILVGPSGTIDVHGVVLSTLDVSNGEFLARGDMKFEGSGSNGVTNMGRINAIGGDVFLIGRTVSNRGAISASGGRVGLAAGEEVLLTASEGASGERMFVRAKGTVGGDTGIYNDGTIEGAAVELKAHGNVYALAINNKGSIRATGAVNQGGKVYLRGAGGAVKNSGSIRASSNGAGSGGRVLIEAAYARVEGMLRAQGGDVRVTGTDRTEIVGSVDVTNSSGKGGRVVVEGREIAVASTSTIDASGASGGGDIRIGGGFQGRDTTIANADHVIIDDGAILRADALSSGKGGNVIVWSDGATEFSASLSARGVSQGGFAEISGKSTLEVSGDIDLTADSGLSGTLLLDPTNITISATGANGLGGSTISNVWLSQQLDAGNNVVIGTNFGSGGNGNITVGRTDNSTNARADRIQWYQNNSATDGGTLTFLAMGHVYFNADVQSAGRGGVNVVAGWDGVTGWSGVGQGASGGPITFDMGSVLATMPGGSNEAAADAAGRNGGSVYLGATNSRMGVAVGSRWGATNVAAQDLILRGSTTVGHGWAQLGFSDNGVEYQLSRAQNGAPLNEWWGAAAGNVQGKNYIALLGGTEFGTGDVNSLGTRAFRGAGWGATGDITVGLSGRLDARSGTTSSFVQIGHGGTLRDGSEWKKNQDTGAHLGGLVNIMTTRDGIQIAPLSNRYSFFSSTWRTNYAGASARIDADIKITAAKDVLIMGAPGFDGATDMLDISTADGIYAMIGHGGAENQGSYHGDVSVVAYGVTATPTSSVNNGLVGLGIQVLGGRSSRAFAKIGHGSGYESNYSSIWDQTMSGDITVTATTGAIRVQAHTQEIRDGDLNTGRILNNNEVIPLNNASDNSPLGSFVQIGHGGQVGALHAAGGTFIMPGGTNVANIVPDASMSGGIKVFAGGTYSDSANSSTPMGILLRAGNRRWYHAIIGHGGTNWNAINTAAQTPSFGAGATLPFGTPVLAQSTGYTGNVSVEADKGSFIATGDAAFRPDRVWGYGYSFVHVGHGGDVVRGNKDGTITVKAGQGAGAVSGDIRFTAGQMARSHAMLGHGGLDADGNILGADNSAKITVIARGDIRFESPKSVAQVDALTSTDYANWFFAGGTGGTFGTTDATFGGMNNIDDRFVQLGHGGRSNTTAIANRQDIEVISGTGDLKNADGDPNTGGITFIAGDSNRSYAMLGHGGWDNGIVGDIAGDIIVKANGGGIVFDATKIGVQSTRHQTDRSLNGITNTRVIQGYGGGTDAFAKLGHGGYQNRGVFTGSITVDAWGGLSFLAAPAAPKVGQTVTKAPLDAALNAGTNVWVPLANLHDTAATVPQRYQMPDLISNIVPGTLRIELSDGSVITDLPNNSSDDRQSGLYRNGIKIGDVHYDWGLVRFDTTVKTASGGSWTGTAAKATFQIAQGLKERAFVQLGHGGYESENPNNKANDLKSNFGDITIKAGGDIRFEAGAAHRNFAQLGHGGHDTKGWSGGTITIDKVDANHLVGGISFIAGHGGLRQYDYQSYAQLGHGGFDADGNHFGNISIRGTQDASGMGLFFKAGDRQDASALLGHGGYGARTGVTSPTRVNYGLNGNINVEVTGDVAFVAGTFTNNNPLYREDGRLFAQIGHGGYDADASSDGANAFGAGRINPNLPIGTLGAGDGSWGHFGDITLISKNGNISFMGGSTIPVGDRKDLDGNPIPVAADPNGFLTSFGDGKGRIHYAMAGHGGYSTSGDHHGNITVKAENGSVQVVAGMMSNDDSAAKYNHAQIGHGGAEAAGHLGRTTEKITIYAGRNVAVVGGQGGRNQAYIGNGGVGFQGTHTGDIQVYAGKNVQMRGGMALERVVRRIGEFQDMFGSDGGAANDIGEFNLYYGTGSDYSGQFGFGANAKNYLLMDAAAAAGGGQKTKLIGKDIQPGTVEFRLAIAAPTLFDANKTPEYKDDGSGNIVETLNPSNIVGSIDYTTGEVTWTTKILTSNTPNQPDLFVNYEHLTGIRNDALYASATIGHGTYYGRSRTETHPETGVTPGFVNRGHQGNIDVRAGVNQMGVYNGSGGSIIGIAGNDSRTYVQIGHGGADALAPAGHGYSGTITTKADGSIIFRGGGGLVDNHYTAYNFYGSASTEVTAVTAAYEADRTSPRYATPLDAGGTRSVSGLTDIYYDYAMIGHGGPGANADNGYNINTGDPLMPSNDPSKGHHGDIFVETAHGGIDFTAGGTVGQYHFAQIGHGGISSSGNHYGNISVISGADINFTAGGTTYTGGAVEKRNYAMIGHGGFSMNGNLAGNITVAASGKIRFRGGEGTNDSSKIPYGAHVYVLNAAGDQDHNHTNRTQSRFNYSLIGHGGEQVFGDKTGDITVTAGNGIDFQGGDVLASSNGKYINDSAYMNYAMIGHGGYRAVRQYRVNNTTPPLPAGAGNADDWDLPFWWDSTRNQYIFDGTFGPNGDGQFFWPSDNSIDPAKGLGKPLYDGFSGDIKVTALGGDISFAGGTAHGTFAQIGHGGMETGGDHSGAITVDAKVGNISFNSNRIEETGGKTTAIQTFTHIGHGGSFSSGEQSGTIQVLASGKISFKAGTTDSYAMIGHGGRESHGTQTTNWGGNYRHSSNFLYARNTPYRPGTRSGDITVTAGGDIAMIGGNNNGDRAFTQIGHGGFMVHANPDPDSQFGDGHNGEIEVTSTNGKILLQAGTRSYAHAMIGHGGSQSFGNHGGDGNDHRLDSDIIVQAKTGIDVFASGRFDSNNTAVNFAQIGHGGRQSSFRDAQDFDANNYAKLQPFSTTATQYINPITGVVNVDDLGSHPLTPFTTNNDGLYLGKKLATLGTFMGDITVRTTDAGADIRFYGPNESMGTLGINGANSFVQLGHGGFRNFGDIQGDITVDSGGGIQFLALQGKALAPNINTDQTGAYALLGHGGYESGGSFNGAINVTARGDVLFQGADSPNSANISFAQLGHGGFDSSKAGGQYREAIRDPNALNPAQPAPAAASITDPNNRPIGNSGNITVNVLNGGNLEFLAGRDYITYAQLGHGGRSTRDTHTGNITVNVEGGIRFAGSVDGPHLPGDNAGTNEESYAQLGHGGYLASGSHSGNISVTAGTFAAGHPEAGRSIVFRSGDDVRNYTQIGHGGAETVGYGIGADAIGMSGDITVRAAGDILFVAGTISGRDIWDNNIGGIYTQIGHGGYNSDVDANRADVTGRFDSNGNPIGYHGDIKVTTAGSIEFLAGDASRTYQPSTGTGGGAFHYAQLGHGGYSASGNHYGDITVKAGVDQNGAVVNPLGRVYFAGGTSGTYNWADHRSYAQLGHGGSSANGNQGLRSGITALNTIKVVAGGDVHFTALGGGINSYVMLGNGGYGTRGDHAANIDVRAGGDLRFEAANPTLSSTSGSYNHYSWSGISATDSSTKTYSLDWAANLHAAQGSVPVNSAPPGGVLGRVNLSYSRVVPGSIKITIRGTGTGLPLLGTLSDDGAGGLIADNDITADFLDGNGTRTITAGTKVADIAYSLSGTTSITFLQDVNPGPSDSTANLAVEFQHWNNDRASAQLGNGGYDADFPDGTTSVNATMYNSAMTTGNMGDISLRSGRDVVLKGGGGASTYAQIGHGGMWNSGRNYGNISIGTASERVGGAVIVQGGGGQYYDSPDAYAQIGHGGRMAYGVNKGDISIYATSGIASEYDGIGLLTRAGTRNGAYAQIGHNGYGTRAGSYQPSPEVFGMEGSSGNIIVNTIGDVDVIAGVLNRGGATVAQMVDDGNLYAQIGHGGYDSDVSMNGSLIYGSGPDSGHHGDITVISEQGSVNVLAGDHLRGLLPSVAPSVGIHDGWEVNGITRMEAYAGGRHHYAQIGNGGIYAVGNHWGNITVQAGFNDVGTQTGTGTNSFVRIWGGRFVADQDDTSSYAMIGQGGIGANGDLGRATDLISVMAAGDVDLKGGDGVNTFAEIGNGGLTARGDRQGDIQVFAGGNVYATASQFSRTQTLGNGLPTRYYHVVTSNAGELNQNTDRAGLLQSVTGGNAAGVLSFRAVNGAIPGSVWVEIYSDAGTRIGTIRDDGTGALRVVSDFTGLVAGAQLVTGQQVGTVNYSGSQLTFTTRVNPGTEGGAPNVVIGMEHTRTERAYVQIGHGGFDADNPDGNTDLGDRGNVRITALKGDIIAMSGASADSSIQIGHGGRSTRGANSGDVILRAGGNIELTAKGEMDRSYIQVGHGGWDADGNHRGDVIVSAGSGSLETSLGMGRYNDLFDFNRDGVLDAVQFDSVAAGKGSVTVTGGTFADSWVQIGHGGRSSGNTAGNASTMDGKVGIEAYSNITLQGGTAARTFVQVGHGGWEDVMNMSLSGNISVISQTGTLGVLAGAGSEAYSLIGHGALRNSLATGPSGTRSGHIYIEADNWNISPNGTTSLARIGHTSSSANNGVTAGNRFTVYGNGGGGTSSYTINSAGYSLIGAQDHLAGGGDVTFAANGDLVSDLAISANSAGKVNLLATRNLEIKQRIQNSGTGAVTAVGGWDGHTGMSGELPSGSLDFVVHVPERVFNIAPVLADKNSWGNNNGVVKIGDGSQITGIAVGSVKGDTSVLGYQVSLRGGDSSGNAYAQIGAVPVSGVSPSGNILARAKEGGIDMQGGDGANTYAQIGHRALGGIVPTLSGSISVDSEGELLMQGGGGAQTSAQIGHGGPGATVNSISGDIKVNVVADIQATGGTGGGAYVQIGHGGSATKGAMSGSVNVTTESNLELLAPHIGDAAYAKIGHGDDLRGSFAPNGGTGTRDGAVKVSADGDITMKAGQIGHVGASSPATQGAGATTWIGVSRSDPTDPTSGSIIADGDSQFAGSEVRIYLPERQNNRVAAGAWIAGTVYGGVKNPWPVQQSDEYTNYIETLGGSLYQPGEHNNNLGNGPVPASGYAFYYNLIELAAAPPTPPTPPTPQQPTAPVIPLPPTPPATDYRWSNLDDWTRDAWLRAQEAEYTRSRSDSGIYYEGFLQYGPNGESIYQYGFSDAPGLSADEEDVLRRHLRHLKGSSEQSGSTAVQTGTGGE